MIPKQAHRSDKILRYISILFVIALWFVSIIGTGCGGGSDGSEPIADNSDSIFVIYPYRYAGLWFFDDASRGLVMEGFEPGISAMIDIVVEDIPDAENGFRLSFSENSFPSHTHTFVWQREEAGGNWYMCPELNMVGWLCPALYKYYSEAPMDIYLKAEQR